MQPTRPASSSCLVAIQSMVRMTSYERQPIMVWPSSSADPAAGWHAVVPAPLVFVTGSRRQPNAMGSMATAARPCSATWTA